jgi:hypothetical protein
VKAIYVIPAAISLVLCASVRAELKFDQTTLELTPTITDKTSVGHFKYLNSGDKPVHFKSVKASCGCTTAQTQKDQVGPGEKGEITATFTIGDRTGQQVKTVTVETDDPAHPTTILTMKTNIPQFMELQPNFVFWNAGEEAKPKTVIAKVGKDVPIKNLDVSSMNPQFQAKASKGSGPGEFKIDIQPKETSTSSFTTVSVKTDFPKEAPKTFYITARVTGPPATPATAAVTVPASPMPSVPPSPGH